MGLSETVSYGVLIGTSLYCRYQSDSDPDPLDLVCTAASGLRLAIYLYHSRYPEDNTGQSLLPALEFLRTFTYPCLVGNLWVRYGAKRYIGYAHPFTMVVLKVMGTHLYDLDPDLTISVGYTLNEISCLYLSNIKENMHALAGTVAFFLTETCLIFKDNISLSPTEISNYGLSIVLVLFSLAYKHVEKSV